MYIGGCHVVTAAQRKANPFDIHTLVSMQNYGDEPWELQVWYLEESGRSLKDVYGFDSRETAEAAHIAFWTPCSICQYYGSDRGEDGAYLAPIARSGLCTSKDECVYMSQDRPIRCLYRGQHGEPNGIPDVRFTGEIEKKRNPGLIAILGEKFLSLRDERRFGR